MWLCQLGAYTQADWFYRAFLDGAPSSLVLHRQAAEKFIAQMRDELARKATLMGPSDPAPEPIREPAPAADDVGHRLAGQGSRSRPWYRDRVGWVLVGGGAASALVGGGFVMSGSGLYDEAAVEPRQSVARDLEDRGRGRVLLGAIIGGVKALVLESALDKAKAALVEAEQATPRDEALIAQRAEGIKAIETQLKSTRQMIEVLRARKE